MESRFIHLFNKLGIFKKLTRDTIIKTTNDEVIS